MMDDLDAIKAELNKAQPARWCDRCKRIHPARLAGGFDRVISQSAKNMADAIDAKLTAELLASWRNGTAKE